MAKKSAALRVDENEPRAGIALCLLLGVMFLSGCATAKSGRPFIDRSAPTGIDAGEGVAIVASEFRECELPDTRECPESTIAEWKEKDLENCLTWGIQTAKPSFAIIPTDGIRGFALNEVSRESSAGDLGARLLSATDFRSHAEALKLRYLILLKVETTAKNFRGQMDLIHRDWITFGRNHDKVTRMSAEVLDIREAHRSGGLIVYSSGSAGWDVMLLLYIIPVPVFHSAMTETGACESLGEVVTRFITLKDCTVCEERDTIPIEANNRESQSSPGDSASARDTPSPGEDVVNCVSGGERRWVPSSKCQ